MYKTYEVISAYIKEKEIKAYEDGRRVADIVVSDCDVDGACKILEVLGYQQLYRAR